VHGFADRERRCGGVGRASSGEEAYESEADEGAERDGAEAGPEDVRVQAVQSASLSVQLQRISPRGAEEIEHADVAARGEGRCRMGLGKCQRSVCWWHCWGATMAGCEAGQHHSASRVSAGIGNHPVFQYSALEKNTSPTQYTRRHTGHTKEAGKNPHLKRR